MPSALNYPGVYVEEIPSGVRTITGVATSIAAFLGRTFRGPVNEPMTINSFGDYERIFGGLWEESMMSYAVRDFYLNGGAQAIIVRLENGSIRAEIDIPSTEGPLTLEASNPGSWGNNIKIFISYDGIDKNTWPCPDCAGVGCDSCNDTGIDTKIFNLIVSDGMTTEKFLNLSVREDDVRYILRVLQQGSTLVRVKIDEINGPIVPAERPEASNTEIQLVADEDALILEAFGSGEGKSLTASVNYDGIDSETWPCPDCEGDGCSSCSDTGINMKIFNLVIFDGITTEKFAAVSVNSNDADYVKDILESGSTLVRVKQDETGNYIVPSKRPNENIVKGIIFPYSPTIQGDDGNELEQGQFDGSEEDKEGIYALEKADLFNLLCIPPYSGGSLDVDAEVIARAASYCAKRRAMLLVDSPSDWTKKQDAIEGLGSIGVIGDLAKNAAIFFPRTRQPNPRRYNQMEEFAPCGAVAGVFARTDSQRGVWKAPAGLDASLVGASQLSVPLTDAEIGELNPLGINCIRAMPAAGQVIWGSRTLQGDDRLASEWKYIPIRRLALYIEESLYRGTQWVVFEPNDEPLWSQIRLNIGSFMHSLFRQGAFQGSTPKEAYFVKCDKETTTQDDINRGVVNILVGFAPLKPAEFVVIKIQQMAGQIQT